MFARSGPGVARVARAGANSFSSRARLGVLGNGPYFGFEGGEIERRGGGEDVELVEVVVRDDDDVGGGVRMRGVNEAVDGELGKTSDAEDSVGKPKARRTAWSAGGREQVGSGGFVPSVLMHAERTCA